MTSIAWAKEHESQRQAEQAHEIAQVNAEVAQRRADALERETRKARKTIEVFQRLLGGAAPGLNEGPDFTVRSFLTVFADDLEESGFDEPEVELVVRESLGAAYLRFAEDNLAANQFRNAIELSRQLGRDGSRQRAAKSSPCN